MADQATLVPTGALWEDPRTGDAHVFVVLPAAENAEAMAAIDTLSEQLIPVERRPVEIVAEGRGTVGVRGVVAGDWVVTVGQHLLAENDARAARVRPTTWGRVARLQRLQREDLLERFLEKQRRVAAQRGASPPPNDEYVGAAATADRAP